MEFTETSKGKPLLIFNRHQYIVDYTNKKQVTYWRCIDYKKKRCKGRISTENNNILSEVSHVCLPDDATNEVRKHLVNAKKRARETDSSISKIYAEEVGQLFNRGYDFVTTMPWHRSTKQSLHRIRRKSMRPKRDPVYPEGVNLQQQYLDTIGGGIVDAEHKTHFEERRYLIY